MQLVPQQRQLNQGVGDVLAKAFEFAATVAILFFAGFMLDRWLGTTPVFMIVMFVFVLVGQTVRLWYSYGAEMHKQEEARREAGRPSAGSAERQ